MPRTIRLVLVGAAVAASIIPAASPAIAETGTTDVTVQVATDDGNLAWSAPTRLLIDGMYHQPGGGTD